MKEPLDALVGKQFPLSELTSHSWAPYNDHHVVSGMFTVTAVKRDTAFGCGIAFQVTPALQKHHPLGVDVWYEAIHFHFVPALLQLAVESRAQAQNLH